MLENGQISRQQLFILVFLFSLGSAILIVPSAMALTSKQDSWISALLGVLLGMLLLVLYHSLGKSFPNQNLVQYSEIIAGKFVGRLISFLYLTFFLLLSALVLRNIGDFMTTIVMPETPIQAIFILFMVIIVMGAGLGLEVIGRAAEIFLPWILLLLFILIVFIMPQMEMNRLYPIFEASVKEMIKGSLTILGIPYLELVIFLMILPYVRQTNKRGNAFLWGGFLGGLVLSIITLLCILVLGWDFTSRHSFPSYTLAKKIQVGEFLQRIEVMMAVIWFLTIFFKLVLCFYAAGLGLAQLLRMQTYRPLLPPLALITVVLALIVYPNNVYFRSFASQTWFSYALIFGFIIPITLLAIHKLKKN
ncbi:spore germination protein KB [Paenibacillus endophyticus]|uniref:Spore germination protein KB n=1 Tax=Paenibacillus endophyticus TaxID=1294268 RepID=A0A7W5C6A7_9BACL|nr:endospore germination permease [Paenibacillus endophyticus]MBB3151732.1 spore germination protein KB [Paenibacillus endophyticus]